MLEVQGRCSRRTEEETTGRSTKNGACPAVRPSSHAGTELFNFEIKVDEQANERYGAFRVGKKDELVTALGLAVKDAEITFGGAIWTPTDWVFFTHGDQRVQEGKKIRLGKAFLVSRLQTLLQSGHLHLPDTSEAKNLARELQDYEIQVVEDANERYGAFQVGTKDDLVTALGMAVQKVPLLRAIY